MKKIFNRYKNTVWALIAFTTISLTSCNEDIDVWDSETLNYSGTFFWELFDEDETNKIFSYDHDMKMMIYNTSENVENKVWMEDTDHIFPLKSKFTFTGSPESFVSTETEYNKLEYNTLAIGEPITEGNEQEKDINDILVEEPTALDQEVIIPRYYLKNYVVDGKILSKAETTLSGNPVDSFYLKLKTLGGLVKFTSYEVPEELRANASIIEYKWEFESSTPDESLDETYVLKGHRKTGFPEDDH
ncbi:lipid-binding protein [Wenyingzhuangia sp. IMCC45574]